MAKVKLQLDKKTDAELLAFANAYQGGNVVAVGGRDITGREQFRSGRRRRARQRLWTRSSLIAAALRIDITTPLVSIRVPERRAPLLWQ
jgi:hypothetical protein